MGTAKKNSMTVNRHRAQAKARRTSGIAPAFAVEEPQSVPAPEQAVHSNAQPQLAGQEDIAKVLGFEAPEPRYVEPEKPKAKSTRKPVTGEQMLHPRRRSIAPNANKPFRTSIILDRDTADRLKELQWTEGEITGSVPTLREYYHEAVRDFKPSVEEIHQWREAIVKPTRTKKTEIVVMPEHSREMALLQNAYTALGERVNSRWLYTQMVERFIAARTAQLEQM